MAKQERIRVRLKAYNHKDLDACVARIVETAQKSGATIVGPIPLPTERQVFTILRSPHIDKDSREQFEIRTHKRLIDVVNPTKETIQKILKMDIPSGVDIEIK